MQIKKDEVKEALLSAGLTNFLEKGYNGASIRAICKDAGTTLGNFYNYFENKLALFSELVDDEYRAFWHFIAHHNDDAEAPQMTFSTMDPQIIQEQLIQHIEDVLPPLGDRFLLLLSYSEGTPYEGTRQELVNLMNDHYVDHLMEMGRGREDDAFADLLAHQVIDALVHILKTGQSDREKRALIAKYLLFVFAGVLIINK